MTRLESFTSQFKDKSIGIAVYDLQTQYEILINADEMMHPASTIKVPVMMEVFHQAEQGLFSLDDRIAVINTFTSIADGSPYSLDIKDDSETALYQKLGGHESICELTRLMIVLSSNLATNILIGKVGAKQVNAFLEKLGIQGLIVKRGVEDNAAFRLGMNNSASARGLTQMMKLIAEEKVVSPQASKEIIQILLGQQFNESIPGLLPADVKVAHKTGWTGSFFHDTGIVFVPGRKPYAITILTRGFPENSEKEAHSCMAQISKMIYEQIV
jgi:beta-lactamase class A